jgi:hypothetical protein
MNPNSNKNRNKKTKSLPPATAPCNSSLNWRAQSSEPNSQALQIFDTIQLNIFRNRKKKRMIVSDVPSLEQDMVLRLVRSIPGVRASLIEHRSQENADNAYNNADNTDNTDNTYNAIEVFW